MATLSLKKLLKTMRYFSFGHLLTILATGRSKELSPTVNEDFVILAKYLGLMDDNIVFTTPLGNDELSRRREAVGLL